MAEMVTVTEAAHRLGVSRSKIWSLLRAGTLEARPNPLDKRQHLIPVEALRKLEADAGRQESRPAHQRQRPRSLAAIAEPELQSNHIEDERWKRFGIRRLTPDEKQDVLAAIEELKRAQAEMLAARGGKPFPPSWKLIDEQRAERTQHLLDGD